MTLLSPVYLLGLLAIAIPLSLHLMNRQNPRIQDFASRMFLEPIPVSSSTSKKLRFRKLLLLRLALVTLLALLFAEPFVNRLSNWVGTESMLNVLVFDRSFSMRHGDRWAQATEKARSLLDSLPGGDKALVLAADQSLTLVGDEAADAEALADLLGSLRPGYARLRYDVMIAQLQNLIDESTLPVKIHLFTDAQGSGSSTRIRDLVPKGVTELQVVTVGSEGDDNFFIRSVMNTGRQGEGDIAVFVEGPEHVNATDTTVSLILNDGTEQKRKIEKSRSGDFVARFYGLPLEQGINRFTARLNVDDELADDNFYYFAIESGRHYPVYFVGDNGNSTAGLFLRTALLADDRFLANNHEQNLQEIPDETVLIIVPDETVLSETEKSDVNRFVRDGGNALIVSGAIPLRKSTQGGAIAKTIAQQTTGFIDTSHPLVGDAASWRTVRIFRHVETESQTNDRPLVSLNDGSPFILERAIGRGREVVIASTLDGIRNDLPLNPVFVPFVLRTAREFAGVDGGTDKFTAGSKLVIEAGGQLFAPSGESLVKPSAIGKENSVELTEPGVYEIRGAKQSGAIAVNIDSAESSMQQLDEGFLAEWQSLAVTEPNPVPDANLQAANPDVQKHQLWRWLLPALLILVILEALYANKLLNIRRGTAS